MKKLREKLASADIDSLPPIPLTQLADDLGAIADELRCAYELDGFAQQLDDLAEQILNREELTIRKQRLNETMRDGRARNADQLIKHVRRDRRHQEDMKLILQAGGTTYRGMKILGGAGDPYINRFTRQEVLAEFRMDYWNQLGRKGRREEVHPDEPESSQG